MATLAAASRSSPLQLAAAPFLAAGELLIRMAEASPRGQALERLNRISDEELAARGTTRSDEARRVLGARAFL